MTTLCDVQEGTLKINRDRNAKTTSNIQEGLPFTIDDVKRQTEDAIPSVPVYDHY